METRLVKRAAVGVAVAAFFAVVVVCWSLWQEPIYEASAHVLVGERSLAQATENGKVQLIPLAPMPERLEKMSRAAAGAIDTRPVAEETIRRLGLKMSPDELLDNLAVEQVETSQFIQLSYTDNDPYRAEEVVNTVGQVSSERISNTGAAGNNITATVYERAMTPESPVSPDPLRNGLIALVAGLVFSAALLAWRRQRI